MSDSRVVHLDRRQFLRLTGQAGGGLMLAAVLSNTAEATSSVNALATDAVFTPSAVLQISAAGIVLYATQPEIGQGVKTSLPMLIAEELEVAWQDVEVRQSEIDMERFGRQAAGGSTAIWRAWDPLRRAGAVAREMLIAGAASRWGVSVDQCVARDSHVIHTPSNRRIHYRQLASVAQRMVLPASNTISLKAKSQYRLLGTRVGGVDNLSVVTGAKLFASDVYLPKMVHAMYVRSPVAGGRVAEVNLDVIRGLSGVLDVFVLEGNGEDTELRSGVAIIAKDTWSVWQARKRLQIEWDTTDAATDDWQAALVAAEQKLAETGRARIVGERGEAEAMIKRSAQQLASTYRYAFLSHAQLEPQCCVAHYHEDEGRLEVWAPTQTPQRAMTVAAKVLGIEEKKITVHQPRVGGGFGRRLMNDYVGEVAAIARRVGHPVKLQWTREDDMNNDFLRAGGIHALRAGLDAEGQITGWQNHFVTFSPDGERPVTGGDLKNDTDFVQLLEHTQLRRSMLPWRSSCGFWRAPGSSAVAFPLQSFLHELAVAANKDHRDFLLGLLGESRWLEPDNRNALHTGRAAGVIRLATEKAGWGRQLPPGRALGLAFYFSHATHVAEVAEVSVDANKNITVHRVVVAVDAGPIVNLSSAESQVQGSVVDGLSAMMGQKITHEAGRVREQNFDNYPLLRMPAAPEIEVHFIESDFIPSGLGEPALPPVAPAVCNAIFNASGQRVRSLPLREEGYSMTASRS
ncbi:MAG: molybdopterin cofactor-binding domain-containing protein [Steroidobacteraceae bacterium]|jgi:isoquinoline 1-oxidoreductase beta subunit